MMFFTRFAPSPTGYLHRGHVANAIFCWGLAKLHHGHVVLRIEDHDQGRCRPEYIDAIYKDLEWLGFAPDSVAPLQSTREHRYWEVLQNVCQANPVFACTCSRKHIEQARKIPQSPSEPQPHLHQPSQTAPSPQAELHYPGTCRQHKIEPTPSFAQQHPNTGLRLVTPNQTFGFTDLYLGPQNQNPWQQCGDLLVRDKHQNWTYQFCVAVDDMDQGITHIIRGQDLVASTGRQIWLAQQMQNPINPQFLHHPLLLDPTGNTKLSKRQKSLSLTQEREAGITPALLIGQVCEHLGLLPNATHSKQSPPPIKVTDIPELLSLHLTQFTQEPTL
jgi:glutamyl/glutaminyl-tRNA synthetase